jgi:signal transduction histidine kinase/ActR/RegA family two-component response regulator
VDFPEAHLSADVDSILDTVDVPIIFVGPDCTLVLFNRNATDTFGLVRSDIGKRPSSVAGLAEVKDLEKYCAQAAADKLPIRRDVQSGDRRFLLRVVPYAKGAGERAGAVLTFMNVTAFRASLDQAVYEREYTKAILNTVSNPLVVLDDKLRVQSANRAFYSTFSTSREKTHGVPLSDLGDDDWKTSGLWTSLEEIVAKNSDFGLLEIEHDVAANPRTFLLDARRVSRAGDTTVLLAFHDITERKQAERRKDEFLALLAHELRNPLAPIRTGLELIRLAGDTQAAVRRVRLMMERQVNQMVRLVDGLLDVSRIASGKIILERAPNSVNELIQIAIEAHRTAIEAKKIDLTVDLPEEPCLVDVDSTRFIQVLSNVLHNAEKFTPGNGKIRVSVDTHDANGTRQVAITISDTGIGIAPQMLARVFELFVQAHPTEHAHGGLGIGLALARQLIEMHGGEIAAHSPGPGHGTAMVITMPLFKGNVTGRPFSQTDVPHVASRVVIIDDNEDAAQTMAMLVEQLGGSARMAHGAASGLAAVQEFQPDIVLLDIGMPDMDGYETCRQIRQQPASGNVVVIAVTGWGQPQDKQRALDAGFDAHLVKPVDPTTLASVLQSAPGTYSSVRANC